MFRESQKLLRGNSTPEKQPSVWDACSPVLFYCVVFGYCYIDPLTYSCDVIILPPRKIPLNFNNRKYFLKLSFPKWHQGAFSLEVFTHSCVIILQVLLQIQFTKTFSSCAHQLKQYVSGNWDSWIKSYRAIHAQGIKLFYLYNHGKHMCKLTRTATKWK